MHSQQLLQEKETSDDYGVQDGKITIKLSLPHHPDKLESLEGITL